MSIPSLVTRLRSTLLPQVPSLTMLLGALGAAILALSLGGWWVSARQAKILRTELKPAITSVRADDAAEKVTIKAKAKVVKTAAVKRKEVKEVLDANEDWANQPVPAALADSLR